MVTEYGMSEELGLVSYESSRRRALFLDVAGSQERGPYAEATAQQIDREVRRIVDEAQARARQVLGDRRPDLDAVAARLLDKEVIEGDDLREMLGLPPAHSHPPLPLPAPAE
jgi:cell division protease FtsH